MHLLKQQVCEFEFNFGNILTDFEKENKTFDNSFHHHYGTSILQQKQYPNRDGSFVSRNPIFEPLR